MIERLSILVVYVVRDADDEALLALHLDRIARHTTVPYRIHAALPRVTDAARERLETRAEVTVWPTEPSSDRGSREHAHHLDALMARAAPEAASHVVTLDLDSFPVADAWQDTLLAGTDDSVVGILRRENGDVLLPHPSCTMLPRSFLEQHPFSFSPDTDGTRGFRTFLRTSGQAADTGIRLAYLLATENLPWRPILRSNRRELHPLIAGIYGDAVFHLGAGARASLFRRDLAGSTLHRLTDPVERVPVSWAPARRWKHRALGAVRGPAERRMIAANADAAARAHAWLRDDPEGLFAFLQGGGPDPDPASDEPARGRRDDE